LIPHRKYHYLDVVVELAWLNDPDSYACGSIITGRISHARQVNGNDLDKKGIYWSSRLKV
jgi:hypothetical protein